MPFSKAIYIVSEKHILLPEMIPETVIQGNAVHISCDISPRSTFA